VGDVRPRQLQHAGRAGQRAFVERGQLAIEAPGQVGPDLVEHFLDDVEVVDEPLGRRRRRALFVDDGGEGAITAKEHAAALASAREQAQDRAAAGGDPMAGDRLGHLLQTLDAQKLAANRFGA